MQQRLKDMDIKRVRKDYPQINYVDSKGVQWIELNRGCLRGCPFCYSDPNFKEFSIPKIESNKVQIIGEGFLYDSRFIYLLETLSKIKFNNKVIYYGFSQGLDYRLFIPFLEVLLSKGRFGLINSKGNWVKGIRLSWDLGLNQSNKLSMILKRLENVNYKLKNIIIFVLTNWKIDYNTCLKKLDQIKKWGVRIDDCTWDTTKKNFIPLYWNVKDYKDFRSKCRKHNQLIAFNGYDPEIKKRENK